MAATTSSSKSYPSRRQYDVFLSFRAKDTRHSFTCYLHDFLRRKGVDAYMDEVLRRGNDLPGLKERIEQSKISIVVFSENYANSSWCLEELAKIMECRETFDQVVLPVFYKVPISDVRNQTGVFGAPFESFYGFEHRVPTWKRALSAASDLPGYILPAKSQECEFVDQIAKETFKMICQGSNSPMTFFSPIQGNQVDAAHILSQVFINFRGKELRYNFVSHLVNAFEKHKIKFFLDKYELRGKDLKNLFVRIKESRIALVIFSTRYAESMWCLDELAEIKRLADKGKLEVIPIFYKVEPEDVSEQKGEFGKKFWKLARKPSSSGDQIKKWKDALECISEKMGLSLGDKSSEVDFIKEIITEVQRLMAALELEEGEDHYDELPNFKKSRQF